MKDFIKWLEGNGFTVEELAELTETKFFALYWAYGEEAKDDDYVEFMNEIFNRFKWAVSYEFRNANREWVQDVLNNNGEGMTHDEAGDVVFHIMGDWQETRNEKTFIIGKW